MKARLAGGVIAALLLGGTAAYAIVADDSSGEEQATGGDVSTTTASTTAPPTTEPPAPSTTRPRFGPDVCMEVVAIVGDLINQELELRDKGSEEVFREPKPIEQSSAELDVVNRNAFAQPRRMAATQIRNLLAANPTQEARLADFADELDRLAQAVTDGTVTVDEASDQQHAAYNTMVLSGGCDP